MAEPVSIVAASLSIATNTFASGKSLYTLISGVKNAPRHVARLSLHLQALNTVLGSLAALIEQEQQKTHHNDLVIQQLDTLTMLLNSCEEVLLESRAIVEPFVDGLARHPKRSGVTWEIFKKDEVEELQKTLQDYKSTLSLTCLVLSTLHSSSSQQILSSIQDEIRQTQRQIHKQEFAATLNTLNEEIWAPNHIQQRSYNEPLLRFLAETETIFSESPRSSLHLEDEILPDVKPPSKHKKLKEKPAKSALGPGSKAVLYDAAYYREMLSSGLRKERYTNYMHEEDLAPIIDHLSNTAPAKLQYWAQKLQMKIEDIHQIVNIGLFAVNIDLSGIWAKPDLYTEAVRKWSWQIIEGVLQFMPDGEGVMMRAFDHPADWITVRRLDEVRRLAFPPSASQINKSTGMNPWRKWPRRWDKCGLLITLKTRPVTVTASQPSSAKVPQLIVSVSTQYNSLIHTRLGSTSLLDSGTVLRLAGFSKFEKQRRWL